MDHAWVQEYIIIICLATSKWMRTMIANYLKEEIRLNTERYQPKVWLLKQCIEWFFLCSFMEGRNMLGIDAGLNL